MSIKYLKIESFFMNIMIFSMKINSVSRKFELPSDMWPIVWLQSLKDLDYSIRDKNLLESVMDTEFLDATEKGLFYNGNTLFILII